METILTIWKNQKPLDLATNITTILVRTVITAIIIIPATITTDRGTTKDTIGEAEIMELKIDLVF